MTTSRSTRPRPPRTVQLGDVLERQAIERPDAPSLHDLERGYSFAQTFRCAGNVAAALRGAGARDGDRVVVCTDRTAHALIAHLGVALAGATLVPVETAGPLPRIQRILEASDASVALVDEAGATTLSAHAVPTLDVDTAIATSAELDPRPGADIAYLLFTSGSTGVPKGVQLTQQNLLAFFTGAQLWDDSTADDVWASFSAFTFDLSVFELWRSIWVGAKTVVIPRVAQLDSAGLPQLIVDQGITSICQTPTAGRLFAAAVADTGTPHTLRRLLLGGERLDMSMLAPFATAVADGRLSIHNMYGPTETSVYATGYRVSAADIAGERRALIGRDLPHVHTRIDRPDEQGVGELLISGAGVARGYRGDPGLTAQRFVPGASGEISYRTGDLVRDTGDGVLEFVGRLGGYEKVRGYRVEMGEVSAAMCDHPQVLHAVATTTDVLGEEIEIVCAVALVEGAALADIELRRHAARTLPVYMRPARVVVFDSFPQLASSKLDERTIREELVARVRAAGGPAA